MKIGKKIWMIIIAIIAIGAIYYIYFQETPVIENDIDDLTTGQNIGTWGQNLVFHFDDGSTKTLAEMQTLSYVQYGGQTITSIDYTLSGTASGGADDPIGLDFENTQTGMSDGFNMEWLVTDDSSMNTNIIAVDCDQATQNVPTDYTAATSLALDTPTNVITYTYCPVQGGSCAESANFYLIPTTWTDTGPTTVTITASGEIGYNRPSEHGTTYYPASLPTTLEFDIMVYEDFTISFVQGSATQT